MDSSKVSILVSMRKLRRLIDGMVFKAVFNSISAIMRRPVHRSMLSWSSFNQYSEQYSSAAKSCFPHATIVETTHSREREMNPVAMTIINPRKEYWPTSRKMTFSKKYRLRSACADCAG